MRPGCGDRRRAGVGPGPLHRQWDPRRPGDDALPVGELRGRPRDRAGRHGGERSDDAHRTRYAADRAVRTGRGRPDGGGHEYDAGPDPEHDRQLREGTREPVGCARRGPRVGPFAVANVIHRERRGDAVGTGRGTDRPDNRPGGLGRVRSGRRRRQHGRRGPESAPCHRAGARGGCRDGAERRVSGGDRGQDDTLDPVGLLRLGGRPEPGRGRGRGCGEWRRNGPPDGGRDGPDQERGRRRRRQGHRTRRQGPSDRRDRGDDRRHRGPDEPAGAQRRDRGGPRRRTGQGLRGRSR